MSTPQELREAAAKLIDEANRLDTAEAAVKAAAFEARKPKFPQHEFDQCGFALLTFTKEFPALAGGQREYRFSALVYSDRNRRLRITTSATGTSPSRWNSWDDFLRFVGEPSWSTLAVATVARSLQEPFRVIHPESPVTRKPAQTEPYHGKATGGGSELW